MRIRSLILVAVIAASTLAVVGPGEPGGAIIDYPDVCQNPKNPPKNATVIKGTPWNDVLFGTEGNDIIRGLGGNDRIYGLAGNDMICGGGGNDHIWGGRGRDRLWGDANNDWFDAGGGDDQVNGGLDVDVINFESAQAPVWVKTEKEQYRVGSGPLERLVNVYKIEGSRFGDTIDVLDGYRNEVQGGSGNDKMTANFSDYLGSDDFLVGGPDDDQCRYSRTKKYFNCS